MKIEHIAMYVNDLERTKYFFEKYFGAVSNDMYHNKKTDFKSYFLSFDDGARLQIITRPEIISHNKNIYNSGYIHIAFSVGSRELVNSLTETLKNDGYEILSNPRVTGDGYYESYVVGIEGNLIEITV